MWPDDLTVAPLRDWPGMLTSEWKRRPSPFDADLTTTLRQLAREVRELTTTAAQRSSVQMLVAISPEQFRLDGKPRARAVPAHPGVILSLDSKHGHLSYPCDTFPTWQANLRAIVLALESLRRVDRYGVTRHGEQYRGFLAIDAGKGATDRAFATIAEVLGAKVSRLAAGDLAAAVRRAKRETHPDTSATPYMADTFREVVEAERVLREAGLL